MKNEYFQNDVIDLRILGNIGSVCIYRFPVWNNHQIDLVDMQNYPVTDENDLTFVYILSVPDIFSRYVLLRPLTSKQPREIVPHLIEIYRQYGPPKSVQHDRGGEFKGEVKLLFAKLNIDVRSSSAYHPQSQGKIERSHGT